MYRNIYRLFPSAATSTTNTTITSIISLRLLNSSTSASTTSFQNNNHLSTRKYFTMPGFYDLEASDIEKKPFNFADWKGKVVLLVNVASKCGYTPQYTGLEGLYKKYKDQGLVVAGFPCNQFGSQEPSPENVIAQFCSSNYNVTFPMFAKIDVNGDNESPVYKFLKSQQTGDIKWNFEKFLIDKNGNVVKKYLSKVKPEEIENDIETYLKASNL